MTTRRSVGIDRRARSKQHMIEFNVWDNGLSMKSKTWLFAIPVSRRISDFNKENQ
jgi:hypothetical protein